MPNRLVQSRIVRGITGGISRRVITRALTATGLLGVLIGAGLSMMPVPTATAAAGINKAINFQGKLTNTDGTNIPDGIYNMEFKLYTGGTGCVASGSSPCGGTLQSTESWLRNNTQGVTVSDGIFQVNLGTITALPAIFNNDTIWLSINLGNTNATCTPFSSCSGDGEMLPFVRFTAAPYALNSDQLGGISAAGFAQINPGSAQAGSLNIGTNIQAGGILQAPLVDTATGVALGVGTATATSVTVGRNTSTTNLTLQGSASTSWSATGASGTTTVSFTAPTTTNAISFPNAGGTLCTTVATTCNTVYQAAAAGGYILKNATDTTSVSGLAALGTAYTFNNTTSAATTSGVLKLDNNANTGSTLLVTANATPTAGAAILKVNQANAAATGNLMDLQLNNTSQFAVDYAGNVTQAGGTSTTDTINGQRISAAANFTGTVTATTSLLAPLLQTQDVTGASAALTVRTGNSTTSGATGALTVKSGNATSGTAGDVTIDTGTTTTGTPTVNVGNANAKAVQIGNNTTNPSVTIDSGTGTIGIGTGAQARTVNVGTGAAVQTVTLGSTNGASVTNIQGGTGNLSLLTNSASAAIIAKTQTNSLTGFEVQNSSNANILQVDTINNRVGINVTGNPSSTLEVTGTFRLSGISTESFVTPLGVNVPTKINIPLFNPGSFGQILSFGIPNCTNTADATTNCTASAAVSSTARGITVFDGRVATANAQHQPSIGVLSPNEADIFGLSWDGANTAGILKTVDTAGSTGGILVRSGESQGSTGTSGTVTIQSGNGVGTNSSSGNAVVDVGSKTGSGTTGQVFIGTANSSQLNLGRTGAKFVLQGTSGTSGSTISATNGANTVSVQFQDPTVNGSIYRFLTPSSASTTYSICTSDAASCGGTTGSYVALQGSTPGTQQTGNLNLSGRGLFGGVGINNTASTNKLNVNTVTTTNTATGSAQALVAAAGAANIGLVVQGTASRTVPLAEFENSTGASILQIGSGGSDNLYSQGRVQTLGGIDLDDTSLTLGDITKKQTAGTGGVTANDVVALVNDGGNTRVVDTAVARDPRVYGVASTTATSGNPVAVSIMGNAQVTATTAAVAIGDQLVMSGTAGQVMTDNNATTGILGIATTAKGAGSAGLVGVAIQPVGGVVNPNLQAGNLTTTGTVTTGNLTANGNTTVGTAGASLFKNNGATNNATCDYTGVTGAVTLNTASKTPDVCTVFRLTTTGAATITVPAPAAGAGSVVYVSNMTASSNAITLLGANVGVGSTATLIYNGTVWTFAGADASGLQTAYNNSGATDPQIQLSNANGGLKVRDAASSTIGNLLQVTDSAGTTTYLAVTSAATTVGGNLTLTSAASRTFQVADQGTAATAGGNLTVKAAAGNTSGVGGNLALAGGAGGNAAAGGTASLTGGASGGGATAGGAVTVQGGASNATAGSNGGAANLLGANGTSTGTGGVGGNVAVTAGSSFGSNANVGGTVAIQGGAGSPTGAGGAVSMQGGTGGSTSGNGGQATVQGGTATLGAGSVGGAVVVQGGTAAATAGSAGGAVTIAGANGSNTGTGGSGGNVNITAGNGQGTAGATNGGNITLTAGAASGGTAGNIRLNANNVAVGTAGASIFKNNGATANATCDYTGVTGAVTLNTVSKTPDVCTVFRLTTTGAATITVPAPAAGAGSVVYVSNLSGSSNAITLLGANVGIGSTATLVYNGTVWTFAGADASGLQTAYNNSATTDPQIQLANANGGLKIRDAASSTITNLLQIADSAGTTNYLTVTSAAATVGGNMLLSSAANRTIQIVDQATAATAGGNLTVKAAAGNTSGVGGNLALAAGAGGNAAAGGAVTLTGGASGGGATAGGSVTIQGGAANATAGSTGGGVTINAAAATTTGTGAAGSAVSINGGAAGGSAANAGGGVTITAGAASGTGTGGTVALQGGAASAVSGSAGGSVTINGANGTATSTGGAGGSITLLAGNGTSSGNNNGGSITFTAGSATGTGIPGVVNIDTPVFTAITASGSYTQSANNQTFNMAVADINSASTVVVPITGAFTGATVTVPAPTNTTTGRVVYITNGSASIPFTLSPLGSAAITMNVNSTATLVWNNATSTWTAAGADASTSLQQVYNNTATAPVSIVTTSTAKYLNFQAGVGFDASNTFQVASSQGAQVISVDTTNSAAGANLGQNGGGETGGTPPTGWSAFVGTVTPTVTQTTTASEISAGTGAVKVTFGSAGTGGVNNALNATALATAATTYNLSFSIKALTSNITNANLIIEYYRNNTPTLDATCSPNTAATNPAINTSTFVKYTCYFTTTGNAKATTNFLRFRQADSVARSWMIDNMSLTAANSTGAQNTSVLRVGGANSQGLTLLTVDSYASAPYATGSAINTDLLGSLYYDTTIGKLQCYEAKGWGSCGNSPNNSAFLIPEYPNAVLGARDASTTAGIGTMTAGVCSGTSRLNVNTALCGASEDFNYYAWTSPQTLAQIYSIYVRYQLPATYNGFLDANTVKLYGRTSNTTDGSVTYSLWSAGYAGSCGSLDTPTAHPTTPVTTSNNTWQQVSLAANESVTSTDCTFAANDIITFRIDLSAKNGATVYASNLTFTTKGL